MTRQHPEGCDCSQCQRWRTQRVGDEVEPRLSRSDEHRMTKVVREVTDTERRDVVRAELDHLIAALSSADGITGRYGRVVAGDHRSSLRAVDHHTRRLQAALRDLRGYL